MQNRDVNKLKKHLLILLVIGRFAATAQPLSLETSLYAGAVWRHTPKLTTQTGETLWGQEIGFRVQTIGRHDWQAWQRYPVWGVSLLHFRLGDGSHGDGWGLLPHLSVPVVRVGAFAAFFRLGTGLAWVSNPYDYFDNPGQNALGGHWNNVTQFRLGAEWRLGDRLCLNTGASLTHFSNGGTNLPNFGINIPAGYAGLAWSPKPIRRTDFLPANSDKRSQRRFGGLLQTALAMLEYGVFDGPKYPVWAGAAAGYFHFNQVNRLHLGVDYEFNRAIYEFGLQSADFGNKAEAKKGATRLAVYVADEFLFGNMGVQLQMGRYVGREISQYVLSRQYSKLTVRAYLPALFTTSLRPHFGITMKAHQTTAEYISLNLGLVL